MQLDKERKVSSAYADELKRTREQNLAVVSAQEVQVVHFVYSSVLSLLLLCAAITSGGRGGVHHQQADEALGAA